MQTNPEIDLPPKQGSAIAIHEATRDIAVADSADMRMLEMIERASRDPTVDIAKFAQLVEMRREHEAIVAERQFDIAMNEAQNGMEQIRTDADNPQTHSRYASYPALDRALRPVYSARGFSLSFNTEPTSTADIVRVTCRVSRGGHTRNYLIDMPADGKGAKGGDVMTKTHATGSAVSYGMRYLLKMIFNIAVARDDDGNAASMTTISEAELEELKTLIATIDAELKKAGLDKHVNVSELCKRVGVGNIAAIPSKKYKTLADSLRQWGRSEITAAKAKKEKS